MSESILGSVQEITQTEPAESVKDPRSSNKVIGYTPVLIANMMRKWRNAREGKQAGVGVWRNGLVFSTLDVEG